MAALVLSGDLYVLAAHYVNEPKAIEVTVTKIDFGFQRPFGFPCLSRIIHILHPASPDAEVSTCFDEPSLPKGSKKPALRRDCPRHHASQQRRDRRHIRTNPGTTNPLHVYLYDRCLQEISGVQGNAK